MALVDTGVREWKRGYFLMFIMLVRYDSVSNFKSYQLDPNISTWISGNHEFTTHSTVSYNHNKLSSERTKDWTSSSYSKGTYRTTQVFDPSSCESTLKITYLSRSASGVGSVFESSSLLLLLLLMSFSTTYQRLASCLYNSYCKLRN